jgi:hypothetical protein
LKALITGETSLNEDQPGEIVASSKSSMKASRWEFVRTRVPLLAQTPKPMPPDDELDPELELELELVPEPEPELVLEPELELDPKPELLPKPPLDELLLVEPRVPEELPLPELPLDELSRPGLRPVAHPQAKQRLAARRETCVVVRTFCE